MHWLIQALERWRWSRIHADACCGTMATNIFISHGVPAWIKGRCPWCGVKTK